jgi:hypothetical protein
MRDPRATKLLTLLLSALVAACGSVSPSRPDASAADAVISDGTAGAPPRGIAVLSGAGRATGGMWTADVQIGSPFATAPATAATDELTTAATLIP